ncbi:MAG: efflux RND transporter periplasmic adaptor subunit [Beijerinckiaceae bacterium]
MKPDPHPLPRLSAPRIVAATTRPDPVLPPGLAALALLEARLRQADKPEVLQTLLVNEVCGLGAIERAMCFSATVDGRLKLTAATAAAQVDAHGPAAQALAKNVASRLVVQFDANARPEPFFSEVEGSEHPHQMLVLPLVWKERMLGALLLFPVAPLRSGVIDNLLRLADTAAHAWAAQQPVAQRVIAGSRRAIVAGASLLVLAALALIPVPMTALAPARIVSIEPMVVAAPVDGVIDDIMVRPNDAVSAGQPLLRYAELQLSSKADNADAELAVADAKFKRVSLAALSNIDAKRELAVVEAERDLKRAERDFALDQLKRSRVLAPRAGVALYGDRRDWIGRPVATGERILEIGDPSRVEAQLELPVEDAIAMQIGQRVSVFLDTAPLAPLAAEVTRINHEPRFIEGKGLAFVLQAKLVDDATPPLGVRGTAHIRGETVPLGLFLLRRPISSFRQWAGL